MNETWVNLAYLVASILFILGMKGMTHPRTAVRGNMMSALAMFIAVIAAAVSIELDLVVVIVGIAIGAAIGGFLALWVKMTAMPQMVAVFNGLGGGASVFVAWADLVQRGVNTDLETSIATAAAGLIGAVTLTGSLVAYAKLEEIKQFRNPIRLPMHQLISAGLAVGAIAIGVAIVQWPDIGPGIYLLLILFAAALGVALVTPIGGADMPVVIALLNSYSGLAAAATGFVIHNNVLIIAGSLVGASGLILTSIMCKAMNRSLFNVIFGGIDASAGGGSEDDIYAGKIKSTSAEEVAMLMDGIQSVVIIPGYGMAVAQAQHAVRDLYQQLQARDIDVKFAIHPVAGRMPGHMNVLLAEVDIPYEKLVESDTINPTLDTVDVAIVLGANDVVNPVARDPDSAIAGMPIVDVDKCRTVVVIKRSLSPGFAKIANPLFAADNTLMFFSDGKEAVEELVKAVKEY